MKKDPLLSVIVPIYKVEEYLSKCLDSIINQTYKNLEIILVDDGSPDKCPQICDEYAKKDNRIKVIHKENGGVSSARNLGLDVSKGEFVTFVDSDDWLDETMYEKMMAKQKEENLDLIFARYKSVRDGLIVDIKEEQLDDFCKTNDLSYMLNHFTKFKIIDNVRYNYDYVMCSIWRMLFRKVCVSNIRFDTSIRYMEDCIFVYETFLQNQLKSGFVDDYLYYYLHRETSATNIKGSYLINNSKNISKKLLEIFTNTKYIELAKAKIFFCYFDCVNSKYRLKYDIDLKEVRDLNKRENYLAAKRIKKNLKSKVKCFCAHYGLFFIFKLKGLLKK